MNATAKLLPCPFCGVGSDRIILQEQEPHTHHFATFMPDHPGSATIECGGCSAAMIDDTVEGVVAAWNARAKPNRGACPGDGSICQSACKLAEESPPAATDERAAPKHKEFAKIVLGTNGQQVLFYRSVDGEINELHCIASFPGYQSDMAVSGIPDASFKSVLDRCDVVMADKIIAEGSVFSMEGLA